VNPFRLVFGALDDHDRATQNVPIPCPCFQPKAGACALAGLACKRASVKCMTCQGLRRGRRGGGHHGEWWEALTAGRLGHNRCKRCSCEAAPFLHSPQGGLPGLSRMCVPVLWSSQADVRHLSSVSQGAQCPRHFLACCLLRVVSASEKETEPGASNISLLLAAGSWAGACLLRACEHIQACVCQLYVMYEAPSVRWPRWRMLIPPHPLLCFPTTTPTPLPGPGLILLPLCCPPHCEQPTSS
jgi:hypothetical protein